MGGGVRFLLFFCACVLYPHPCLSRVVINELYYDHPGTDTGHEFIELHCAAETDISGATLEFHNGTGTTWVLFWTAPPGTVLAADGIYLIGGELVTPRPHAVTTYALQNGPDAIRLVSAEGDVFDTVGYGGLDDPVFVELMGAAPVTAGKSIARALDGVDSNDNSLDFIAATPSPGRHNVAREDVALVLAPEMAVRGARDAPGAERLAVLIENRGLLAVAARDVSIELIDSTGGEPVLMTFAGNRDVIAPGREERVVIHATLAEGYHWLDLVARYARDERDDNDRVQVLRRVGRVPLLVSEVWSAPRDGCPQFVELMNASDVPLDLTGFSLRDERARPVLIDADSLVLEPRGWTALAGDPDRLAACAPGAVRERLHGVRGAWPTFNRSGGAVADSIVVLDRHGIVVDAVSYPAVPTSAAGRSLERIDLFLHGGPVVWRLSDAADGCSPAQPNRAYIDRPAPQGTVAVSPNPFAPSRGDVLRVAASPSPAVARLDASVYDVEGRRVAALGGTSSFPALLVWDGRRDDGTSVRPGIYLVAVEMYQSDGVRVGVEKVVVGCAPGAPP